MKTITDMVFDEESALYGVRDIIARNCKIDGPAEVIICGGSRCA